MSLEDILDTVTKLSRNIGGEEENLQNKEKMEKEYITHLSREENLDQDEIGEAVSVFMQESKLGKRIAEDLIHLDGEDIKLRQFIEEQDGKVADNISKFEDSTEDIETLTEYFLDEMNKLQDEGKMLKRIVQSRGSPESKEKFRKAERNVEPAIELTQNIKSENSVSRRTVLEAGAAAGIAGSGYLLGNLEDNRSNESRNTAPPAEEHRDYVGVKASAEILNKYLEMKKQLTHKRNINVSLPIALGERHRPPGNSFKTILRLMKRHKPNKLGLEFLLRGSSVIEQFNAGEISASEMAEHYLSKSRWARINEQVLRVFEYAEEENVQIVGLEYTSGKEHYNKTEERFKKMADIVEEVNEGQSIFLAGAHHVDSRTHIRGAVPKNAHPEIAKDVTLKQIKNDPYIYRKFEERVGIPYDEGTGEPLVSRGTYAVYRFPEKYTLKGRVNNFDAVVSTHAAEQELELQKTLNWLKETAIDEYEMIQDIINKIESEIEKMKSMSSKEPYTAVSESGYGVFVESTPPPEKM